MMHMDCNNRPMRTRHAASMFATEKQAIASVTEGDWSNLNAVKSRRLHELHVH